MSNPDLSLSVDGTVKTIFLGFRDNNFSHGIKQYVSNDHARPTIMFFARNIDNVSNYLISLQWSSG